MLGKIVAVLALCSVCQALDLSSLMPYNLTASLMFQMEDTNADGQMSIAELEAVFNKYDANGNGQESRHEYTNFICDTNPALYQLSHYLYDDYDFNGDHHLEQADYDAFHVAMDSDGDNMVSEEEFVTYWTGLFTKYEGAGYHEHGNSATHGAQKCHTTG